MGSGASAVAKSVESSKDWVASKVAKSSSSDWLCPDGLQTMNYILVGNPGVGKSTILNGMIGKVLFKNGFTVGQGMTFQLEHVAHEGINFYDTPGLADPRLREPAAKAIEQALKVGGEYKIVFVVCLQAGRVSPQDITTIRVILKAVPKIGSNYSIIVNKVPKRSIEKLNAQMDELAATMFCDNSFPASAFITLNPKVDSLEDANDRSAPLPENLKLFFRSMPAVSIQSEEVGNIQTGNYDEMTEKMSAMVDELLQDKAQLEQKITEQSAKFVAQMKQIEEQHVAREEEARKVMLEQLERDRRANQEGVKFMQDSLEQQQRQHQEAQAELRRANEQQVATLRRIAEANMKSTCTESPHAAHGRDVWAATGKVAAGAASGAAIGSAIPLVGTAIGGAVGGIVGYGAHLLS